MKSVICQLPWKLRTTMCFFHSIFIFKIIPIFEIILVFKIMIVIRFQIWFLIKFKLQRREWVWLKLGFSHAKGLYTINTDLRVWKRGTIKERKTLKEETPKEAITRNPKREKHKKKREGGNEPYTSRRSPQPSFF